MVGRLKGFFQLIRLHASPASMGLLVVAGWVGGASLREVPLLFLLGFLAHAAGFSRGAIADLELDRKDPEKAHHPHITGLYTQREIWAITLGAEAGAWTLVVYLGWAHLPVVLPLWALGVLGGNLYVWWGKKNPELALGTSFMAWAGQAWAVGALTHGASPLLPPLPSPVFLVGVLGGLWMAFGCEIDGAEKDLGQVGERNLLRDLGTTLKQGIQATSPPSWGVAGVLTVAKGAVLTELAMWGWGVGPGLVIGAGATLLQGVYAWVLVRSGPYDRPARMKAIGLGNVGTFFMLGVAVAPVVQDVLLVVLLQGLPVLMMGANRAIWGMAGIDYKA